MFRHHQDPTIHPGDPALTIKVSGAMEAVAKGMIWIGKDLLRGVMVVPEALLFQIVIR
jgi:hypothetical protein